MPDEAIIERMAEAMWMVDIEEGDLGNAWHMASTASRVDYLAMARAAYAAEHTTTYPHEWRDEDTCSVCGHLGEHHYCERETGPGTCDDDWCTACVDSSGVVGARYHQFTKEQVS